MDVPTLMHNLREEVSCSVCIHLYKEPKQLPCLHIFCLECLNGLARTNARHGKIKCPLCQIEVAVPDSGTMETLPDCFYLKNLLDILAIKECNTSKVTCGNCEKKSDEASYCFHCCKFWCKECLNAHSMLRENKEHRVLALKDFEDKDFEDVIKRPAFCPKDLHERKVLKFYCKVCEVPACKNCVTLDHGKHEVEHLEITARAVRNDIGSKLDTARKSRETISTYLRQLEEQSRLTERQSQFVKGQIQKTVQFLMSTLQQKEQELVTEVENQTKEALENFMKDKTNLQNELRKEEEFIAQVERLAERSTGAELGRAKSYLDELFQNHLTPSELIASSNKGQSYAIAFSENQALSESLQTLGIGCLDKPRARASQCTVEVFNEATAGLKTRFELITRRSNGEQCYYPEDLVAVDVVSVQGGIFAVDVEIKDRKNGKYEVSCIPKLAGEHRIIALVNGLEFTDFPAILVNERSYKPMGFFGKERHIDKKSLKCPWGVAVNDSNEIFVSDRSNNRILVFNEKGEFVRSFGHHVVDKPTGVCTNTAGRTYVANLASGHIQMFKPNGEYIAILNNQKTNNRPLNNPRGISLDAQGNLIVCDTGNECVKVFSPESGISKTIGWSTMPTCCLCYEDKIFVSDYEEHRIKVYGSEGKFLYEFGNYGTGNCELNQPAGIAVDKSGHLLVCSFGNNAVQVFTLDGNFITSFGEYGDKLGQFHQPSSVSVLKNGQIVISEFGNHRLQMFE